MTTENRPVVKTITIVRPDTGDLLRGKVVWVSIADSYTEPIKTVRKATDLNGRVSFTFSKAGNYYLFWEGSTVKLGDIVVASADFDNQTLGSGAGGVEQRIRFKGNSGEAIPNKYVWLTTTNAINGTMWTDKLLTDDFGYLTAYVNIGVTYYAWSEVQDTCHVSWTA
jgi:hypothetical protein